MGNVFYDKNQRNIWRHRKDYYEFMQRYESCFFQTPRPKRCVLDDQASHQKGKA